MSGRPDIAIIMANHNGARFIGAAIRSILRQTLCSWELIVVDDASSDDSVAVAERAAAGDPRIRIVAQRVNRGAGVARNCALDLVTARWIAIVDSDDLLPPQRLESLLRRAHITGATIIADNLLEFSQTARPRSFLPDRLCKEVSWISLESFIRSNTLYSRTPPLGYLKPLIRTDVIRELGLRYDETLRIGEDYDFLIRLMARGYRMLLDPASVYFYRKHESSTSHRLRASDITALIAADARFSQRDVPFPRPVAAALKRRRRTLQSLLAYDNVITALKGRDFLAAARCAAAHPPIWPMLMQPIAARLRRLAQRGRRFARCDDDTALETLLIESATTRTSGVPS